MKLFENLSINQIKTMPHILSVHISKINNIIQI